MSRPWVGRLRTKSVPWLVAFSFRALVRREPLARPACSISQRGGRQRRRLWVPVIREFRVAASLIFLSRRDRSAPWCAKVSLFDASPWGGAAVAASTPAAVVKETGRYNHRWRISRGQEFNAAQVRWSNEHISDQFNDPRSSYRRHSHRHRSHCHQCLTCRARSGSTAEFEDEAQVGARFTASHTRGMESIDGAEETHTRSPHYAQTSPCRRGCHGRGISTHQRSIVVSNGYNLPCSVPCISSNPFSRGPAFAPLPARPITRRWRPSICV